MKTTTSTKNEEGQSSQQREEKVVVSKSEELSSSTLHIKTESSNSIDKNNTDNHNNSSQINEVFVVPQRKKKINLLNFMTKPLPRNNDTSIYEIIQKMKENIDNTLRHNTTTSKGQNENDKENNQHFEIDSSQQVLLSTRAVCIIGEH
jgi:methyltransferase-like protein